MACVCKACGETLSSNAKERKPFNGPPYSILYEIAQDERPPMSPADIHRVLASAPSYVCKPCHSALSKYHNIKKQMDKIRMFVKSSFSCTATTESPSLPVSTCTVIYIPTRLQSCLHWQKPSGSLLPCKSKRCSSGENVPSPKRVRVDAAASCRTLFPKSALPTTLSTSQQVSPTVTVGHLTCTLVHPIPCQFKIICLQVVVSKKQKCNRYFHVTKSQKKIGKYVGRGKTRSIAKAVVENAALRDEVLLALCTEARKEFKKLCSDCHDSILRITTKPAVELFTWERVWLKMQLNVPLLLSFLTNLISPTKRDDRSIKPALCMCASIILKLQNQKLNVVQTMIGLVLKGGHATTEVCTVHCINYLSGCKSTATMHVCLNQIQCYLVLYTMHIPYIHACMQVFTRLQKLQLCTSYKAVLKTLDDASEGHDEQALHWKQNLEDSAAFHQQTHVCVGTSNLCIYLYTCSVHRVWVYPFLTVMIPQSKWVLSISAWEILSHMNVFI